MDQYDRLVAAIDAALDAGVSPHYVVGVLTGPAAHSDQAESAIRALDAQVPA